jgi:hypothetical protein
MRRIMSKAPSPRRRKTLVLEPGLRIYRIQTRSLERLLVLRPAHGGGTAAGPLQHAAAVAAGMGHQQRGAADSLAERRGSEVLSVRETQAQAFADQG